MHLCLCCSYLFSVDQITYHAAISIVLYHTPAELLIINYGTPGRWRVVLILSRHTSAATVVHIFNYMQCILCTYMHVGMYIEHDP